MIAASGGPPRWNGPHAVSSRAVESEMRDRRTSMRMRSPSRDLRASAAATLRLDPDSILVYRVGLLPGTAAPYLGRPKLAQRLTQGDLEDITMRTRRRAVLSGFIAISTIAILAPNAAAQTKEPYPGFAAYVSTAVQTWKIPGLSIAIVRNDSVIYARGFGVLAVRGATPVNEKTLFEIGSSSKAFTATLIAMLVTDGKMHWDDRLTTYLPDFRMYDPVANEAVTIRDALSHRSGIARGELAWLGSGVSRDEVLHRVRFLKPEAPFRSHYSYQNMMFLAAGQAAGKEIGRASW